jgi:putative transcriptional regulator
VVFKICTQRKITDKQLKEAIDNMSNTTENYQSDALKAIHGSAKALHKIKAIDKQTMRHFDDTCLMPIADITPEAIKAIRDKEKVSQPVFAEFLGLSKNIVSDWERGIKKPRGSSLRLLQIIDKHGLDICKIAPTQSTS